VYLDWAKFPITETEQLPEGYRVRLRDLRYEDPERAGPRPLTAAVELDRNLNIVAESFGWRRQPVRTEARK
jgi:hypothetical protein